MNFGLLYSYNNDATLYGYSDSDCGGDQDERKTLLDMFSILDQQLSLGCSKSRVL